MHTYSVVNVENLKLFEPSMMTDVEAEVGQVLPFIEYLAPSTMDELKEDLIL